MINRRWMSACAGFCLWLAGTSGGLRAQGVDLSLAENRADIVMREALKRYPHDSVPMISVYQQVGNGLVSSGVIDSAIGFLQRAHKLSVDHLGEQDVNTALLAENLGLAFMINGQYLKAYHLFNDATMTLSALSGEEDIDAVLARSKRGEAALALSRPHMAVADFRAAGKALEAQIGADAPGVIRTRMLEALAEMKSGQVEKGEAFAERLWDQLKQITPDASSALYAETALTFGHVLYVAGKFEDGMRVINRELEKFRNKNLEDHPLHTSAILLACRYQLRLNPQSREICYVAKAKLEEHRHDADPDFLALQYVLAR